MKVKNIILVGLTFLIFSCNNNKSKVDVVKNDSVPAFSFRTLIAIFVDKDSVRKVGFISRQVTPRIKVDSSNKKSYLAADTLTGYTINYPITDANKKPVFDSLGKPKIGLKQILVHDTKDTIIWLSNLDIDSLLKIKGKF